MMNTVKDTMPQPGIDLLSRENQINPFPIYARMRDEFPLCRLENGLIALSRYEDIKMALSNYTIFRDGSASFARAEWLPEDCQREIFLVPKSPPDHEKYRVLVNKAFLMSTLKTLVPVMEEKAKQLLEQIPRRKTVNFLDAFAQPYASTISCLTMGIEPDLYDRYGEDIRAWINLSEHNTPNASEEHRRKIIDATRKLNSIYDEIFAERARNPRDDLFSTLLYASVDGTPLTPSEVRGALDLLLAAGFLSTSQFLGSVLLELAERPQLRRRLTENPGEIPLFVEEMLRFAGPTQSVMRVAAQDFTLHDVTIPAGSVMQLLLLSGNRDEREFESPNQLDIHRAHKKHISFGHGTHMCLGAALVRVEVKIAIETLLEHFKDMECAPRSELPWTSTLFTRAVSALPAVFQ